MSLQLRHIYNRNDSFFTLTFSYRLESMIMVRGCTNMKRTLFILLLIVLSLMAVSSALAQDGEMACPGHDGNTIASLRLCVTHSVTDGHITSQGIATSLFAKLDAAQAALDRGDSAVAVNILGSFVNEVQAQAGKNIHAEHATHMIEHAQRVIVELGG
jgi:FIMAH domain-containing protein